MDQVKKLGKPVYLNMRATFWIKAFLGEHISGEYKSFLFDESRRYFIMCLLNSSLFWWYWVCISDCWHITKKELASIRVPEEFDMKKAKELALKLELDLEKSKVYVATKQTAFEYKHKMCIETIHKIDDFIASVYDLSKLECEYIKSFNLKYRLGVRK